MTDIRVPNLGESVTEATISKWFKAEGDAVAADEPLLELETDKVSVEVPAPASGTLSEIAAKSGETVNVGALLGQIAEGAGATAGGARSGAQAKATSGEPSDSGGEPAGGASEPGESRAADGGASAGKAPAGKAGETQAGAGAEAAAREGASANAPSGNGAGSGNGAQTHDTAQASPAQANLAQSSPAPSSPAPAARGDAGAGTEVRVPTLGESVTEATVARILKKAGDRVAADEAIVELETDKVSVEVPSPAAGTLTSLAVKEGDTVAVGALLATVGGAAAGTTSDGAATSPAAGKTDPAEPSSTGQQPSAQGNGMPPAPSARKAMEEAGLSAADVEGTGRRGQIMKGDVLSAIERGATAPTGAAAASAPASSPAAKAAAPAAARAPAPSAGSDGEREERVTMTRLRRTIARRLKDAQNTAAMLTTFNDVDMSGVMKLRTDYKDVFEKKHGVKLGFMAFFAKACVHALRDVPAVNAEVDGDDLVYKNYYHLGIAVGTDKGLVVPVVRDADRLSFAEIEKTIAGFGRRARDGQLKLDEMQGGTFTITNGGIYGSLMSTPILNAPQSGILGMHRIEQRPVALNGQVVIRPMMYLALSYDHRIVDGKEAVTFLVRVKESIEDPQRLLLDL